MKLIALTIALLTLSCGLDPNDLAPSTKGLETYFSDRNVSAGHLSGFVESQGVNGRKATNKLADNTGKAVVKADETTSKYFSDRNISAGDMQNFENKVASDTEMGAMDTKGYFKSKYKAIVIGDRDERTAINEDRRRLDELESRASTSEGRLSSAESRIAAEEAKSTAQAELIEQMKLATDIRFALAEGRIEATEQDLDILRDRMIAADEVLTNYVGVSVAELQQYTDEAKWTAQAYADANDSDTLFDPSGLQSDLAELENVVIPGLALTIGNNSAAIISLQNDPDLTCSVSYSTQIVKVKEIQPAHASAQWHLNQANGTPGNSWLSNSHFTSKFVMFPIVTCPGV